MSRSQSLFAEGEAVCQKALEGGWSQKQVTMNILLLGYLVYQSEKYRKRERERINRVLESERERYTHT